MGIFGALTTAVGGLRVNSYALENVSGNIAMAESVANPRGVCGSDRNDAGTPPATMLPFVIPPTGT